MNRAISLSNSVGEPVTVIMPCYNACRWLDEAINSVLKQSYGNFQFIIIDDGSLDDTLKVVKRFAKLDKRIHIIAKPNTGLADSLNLGIKRASGKWIARIDADDICEPARLERQVQLAEANPELVYIGTGLTEIDENGNQLSSHRYPLQHNKLVRNLRTARKFPPHSSAFYRADAVRSIDGYRPRIVRAQDQDMWLRLSEVGELSCLDEPLVRIRKHGDQISHDESGRRQKIDSRVGMTSYWLRKHGFPDPVDADEATFNIFRLWLIGQLEENELFKFHQYKVQLKKTLARLNRSPKSLFDVISTALVQPSMTKRFLKERLCGESISSRLALKWIKQKKSCVAL